jgi:hypothetical protein
MALDKIDRRKKELQAEIDRIEENYLRKASEIERKVKSVLRPVHNIRKNPFTSIGISVAVGFAIGFLRKKKSSKPAPSNDKETTYQNGRDDTGFTTLFLAELKRLAAQRAMMYVSDLVDKKVMPRFMNDSEVPEERQKTDPNKTSRR